MAVVQAVEQGTTSALGHGPFRHHDDCARQLYMDRQALLYEWNRARYHDYDLHDRAFWRIWGKAVPYCTCPGQQPTTGTIVQLRSRTNGHKNGEFKLHWGQMSAPVYSQLRSRLGVMLFRQTGNVAVVDMELESLAPMAGQGSKSVLRNLMAFEATQHRRPSFGRGRA